MKAFTVYIPDDKVQFFMELAKSLRFKVKEEVVKETELSEAHQSVLNERLENYRNHPESYIDWDDAQKDIEKIL